MESQAPELIVRWFHFLAGIMWIGLLYYFNFLLVRPDQAPDIEKHDRSQPGHHSDDRRTPLKGIGLKENMPLTKNGKSEENGKKSRPPEKKTAHGEPDS